MVPQSMNSHVFLPAFSRFFRGFFLVASRDCDLRSQLFADQFSEDNRRLPLPPNLLDLRLEPAEAPVEGPEAPKVLEEELRFGLPAVTEASCKEGRTKCVKDQKARLSKRQIATNPFQSYIC